MATMAMMMLIFAVLVTILVARQGTRQLPPASTSEYERRLAEQAEQIEQLQGELRRLQEQADFTEKLLTERADSPPSAEDGPAGSEG